MAVVSVLMYDSLLFKYHHSLFLVSSVPWSHELTLTYFSKLQATNTVINKPLRAASLSLECLHVACGYSNLLNIKPREDIEAIFKLKDKVVTFSKELLIFFFKEKSLD